MEPMNGRHLIVLGTASQAPTRYRHHNSYALRWDDQLVLFDPGEGTQRQCILAGVAVARATAVCVTHFHGDHCLGLPGVIQRRALDNRAAELSLGPLPVFFPAEGVEYFDRLRHASVFYDTSEVVACPIEADGPAAELGNDPPIELSARQLDHRVPTYGYRIDEPDSFRLDADRLAGLGIAGPDVGRLIRDGRLETPGGTVALDDVSLPRPGQSFAFVMDTRWCPAALELADGVDLLVCESTFVHRDAALAHSYRHLTALQAGMLARDAGARRLVLTHFSARYTDSEELGREAQTVFDDVVVAEDLLTVPMPPRR
jgi:ribonuclease Z